MTQGNLRLGTMAAGGKVRFDGESIPSERDYKHLGSYTPTEGDRVLLAYVGGAWVVLGKLV